MIKYPSKLNIIFDKLLYCGAKPIIIGGFIRDYLLNIPSKDIDIEVYNISSFSNLEIILQEFGSVNKVGRSFGVCKLTFQDMELDFTLPRVDSKTTIGHQGFDIKIDPDLDFFSATSRRDFTINAIGFDVAEKKILDPFNGIEDLKNQVLRAVNEKTFIDDPLRVLRAVQFCARFNLTIDKPLLILAKDMIKNNMLDELSKDRIFQEIKKLLLKSKKPSIGFRLLKKLGAFKYFSNLQTINKENFNLLLSAMDKMRSLLAYDEKTNIVLMLASICYNFDAAQITNFIKRLTDEKEILTRVLILIDNYPSIDYIYASGLKDLQLYKLAAKVNINEVLLLSKAIHFSRNNNIEIAVKKRAIELNILNKKMTPILRGRDILTLQTSSKYKIKPSKEFTIILNKAYEAQMRGEFTSYSQALVWLEKYLPKEIQ